MLFHSMFERIFSAIVNHGIRDFLREKPSRYIVVTLKIAFGFLSGAAFQTTSLGSQIRDMAIVILKLPS